MAGVRMSAAQARALGIGGPPADPAAAAGSVPGPARRRRGGERLPAPVYVCRDCAVQLVGEAASVRHLADNHHCRFELVLNFEEEA